MLQGAGADVHRRRPLLEPLAAGRGAHQVSRDRPCRLLPREHEADSERLPLRLRAADQGMESQSLPLSGAPTVYGRLRGAPGEQVHPWIPCEDHRLPEPVLAQGGREERGRDLPDPARCAELVEGALRAARSAVGAEWTAVDVILAGQSFGGLAAAETVLRRPDLAAVGIAQSGSFWFGADGARGTGRGRLLRWVEEIAARSPEQLTGRLLVQVGAEEGGMLDGSAQLVESLRPTPVVLAHEVRQGGHDYAWWRHGLSAALDLLEESERPDGSDQQVKGL